MASGRHGNADGVHSSVALSAVPGCPQRKCGKRPTLCGRKDTTPTARIYLEACARLVTALADHYGKNPTVIGWQLDNEPGNPQQTFDAVSERAFEQWLKNRYGTLDELNRVYNAPSGAMSLPIVADPLSV